MRGIFLAVALLLTASVQAAEVQTSAAVAEIFSRSGFKGTFVLYDIETQQLTGFDQQRANTRYIPASTFKIPSSLIGLSTGAVSNVDEVFIYDGKPAWIKAWAHDMTLREAFKLSNVLVYQQVARRIGLERMKAEVAKMDYGNGDIGTVVDDFWLEGPLKISAVEQTRFLARLALGQLPFPAEAQAQVRDIAKLEQGENWVLYGKTGWTGKLGWWVGWVEQDGKLYSFALNMDMPDIKDTPKRLSIGKDSLRALGLLQGESQ